MKTVCGLLMLTMLSACGARDRMIASATGYAETCIKGVTYYQFTSGVTVGYAPDGRVLPCK